MESRLSASKFILVLFVPIGCARVCHAYYVNNWDEPASFECYNGQYLNRISSVHSNRKEDRRWEFACAGSGANKNCMWTGYENEFDEPLAFLCPGDSVMTGMYSYHYNYREDRRFKFKCCTISKTKPERCYVAPWANNWDGYMNFVAPHGHVIKGAFSYHDNYREDRRWRFVVCFI